MRLYVLNYVYYNIIWVTEEYLSIHLGLKNVTRQQDQFRAIYKINCLIVAKNYKARI